MISNTKKYKELVEERDRLNAEVDNFHSECDSLLGEYVLKLKDIKLGGYSAWVNEYTTFKSDVRFLGKIHPKRRKKHLIEAIYEVLKSDLNLKGGTEIYIKENRKNGDIHIISGGNQIRIRIKMTLDNRPWETEIKASRAKNKNYFLMVKTNDTTGYVRSELNKAIGKWVFVYKDKRKSDSKDDIVMDDWVDQLVMKVREIMAN